MALPTTSEIYVGISTTSLGLGIPKEQTHKQKVNVNKMKPVTCAFCIKKLFTFSIYL